MIYDIHTDTCNCPTTIASAKDGRLSGFFTVSWGMVSQIRPDAQTTVPKWFMNVYDLYMTGDIPHITGV